MQDYKKVYERFVNLAIESESSDLLPALELVHRRLLSLLCLEWSNGKKVTVVEAANLLDEVAISTAYKKLKNLRQKGYIKLSLDEVDSRIKYVEPTELAENYFRALGKIMSEAAKVA